MLTHIVHLLQQHELVVEGCWTGLSQWSRNSSSQFTKVYRLLLKEQGNIVNNIGLSRLLCGLYVLLPTNKKCWYIYIFIYIIIVIYYSITIIPEWRRPRGRESAGVALDMPCLSLNLLEIFYRAFVCESQISETFLVLVWILCCWMDFCC